MHVVLAANAQADQPWVADATATFAGKAGATVAVLSVDELELERYGAAPAQRVPRPGRAGGDSGGRPADRGRRRGDAHRPVRARADRILEFADSQQADAIVVGTSLRPAVARRLLGSVPLALVEQSTRPVVVVPAPR